MMVNAGGRGKGMTSTRKEPAKTIKYCHHIGGSILPWVSEVQIRFEDRADIHRARWRHASRDFRVSWSRSRLLPPDLGSSADPSDQESTRPRHEPGSNHEGKAWVDPGPSSNFDRRDPEEADHRQCPIRKFMGQRCPEGPEILGGLPEKIRRRKVSHQSDEGQKHEERFRRVSAGGYELANRSIRDPHRDDQDEKENGHGRHVFTPLMEASRRDEENTENSQVSNQVDGVGSEEQASTPPSSQEFHSTRQKGDPCRRQHQLRRNMGMGPSEIRVHGSFAPAVATRHRRSSRSIQGSGVPPGESPTPSTKNRETCLRR